MYNLDLVRVIALKSDQIEASDRQIVVDKRYVKGLVATFVLIESQSEVRFLEERFGPHL